MAAFAEQMEGLEAHVLDAFVYQDESPPSTGSDMFGGEEDEWMDGASWGDEEMDVEGGEGGGGEGAGREGRGDRGVDLFVFWFDA